MIFKTKLIRIWQYLALMYAAFFFLQNDTDSEVWRNVTDLFVILDDNAAFCLLVACLLFDLSVLTIKNHVLFPIL